MANQSKLMCEHFELYSLNLSTNSSWNLNQNNDIVVYTNKYELSENIFLSDTQRDSNIITIES